MKKQFINRRGEVVDLDLGDSGIVPEGHGIRVSSFLMDGVPTPVTDDEAPARAAYADMKKRAEAAWRTPVADRSVTTGTDRRTVSVADADAAYQQMVNRTANSWRS